MDFGETLLAAQKNQQQKSSDNVYYRAKFEPPKKEQKPAAKLSANIQRFLAKKEEEERRKQEEARRKRDELLAMRDPKATKKIQKMLKVIKSANKSVLEEATDRDNTAVTRGGAEQPDQDDYGYESQEAAALYSKMMEKYSKIPDEEKFPTASKSSKKDLEGTRERMRAALQREDEPQPRQRKSRSHHTSEKDERSPSPPPPEKKPEKPKMKRAAAPPPIDFNQLLKLAEQKKDEPVALAPPVRRPADPEPERPMTKRQKKEFEEEQARREARKRRMQEAEGRRSTVSKNERPRIEPGKKNEGTFTRIPKLSDKNTPIQKNNQSSVPMKRPVNVERSKLSSSDTSRDITKIDQKKSIELKSQNTYRIEKGHGIQHQETFNRDERGKYNRPESSIGHSNKRDEIKQFQSNRSNDQSKVRREDERSQANRQEERMKVIRENDRNNRPDDRNKVIREDERGRPVRPEDRNRMNRPDEMRQVNKPDNQNKVNRGDQRQQTNKPDSVSSKVLNREQDRRRSDDRGRLDRSDDRVLFKKKDNMYANGHATSSQNRTQFKPSNQEQSRKPVSKDNVLSKERMLFGNDGGNPKPNGHVIRQNSGKPLNLSEQRTKEGQPKLTKLNSNDRKMSSSNVKPNQLNNRPVSKTFDFDKHVNSLKKGMTEQGGGPNRHADDRRKQPSGRNPAPKRRAVESDSEYDSELDDFIDDGEDDADYSHHIKEIFGYDRSRYRDMDEDDTAMESSFAQQMREEYVSKKIGIMEDLEDMRLEALEKKKSKKRRRISDDD